MPIFAEGGEECCIIKVDKVHFSAVKKFKGKVEPINIGQNVVKALITFSYYFFHSFYVNVLPKHTYFFSCTV